MAEVRPHGALLVGSVNLDSAEDVMRLAGQELGRHLRYVPDGESGDRDNWIVFQATVLHEHPDIELVPRDDEGYGSVLPSYRPVAGIDASRIDLRPLGYADAAEASYATFRRLRDEGVLPPGVRFQVSLPTPLATVGAFVHQAHKAELEPVYEAALLDELRRIQDSIPASDLAVQWDVALEVGMWENVGGLFAAHFEPVREGTLDRFARVASHVDADVALGFHLCYGDFGHEHFVQPTDTALLTEMATGIFQRVDRPIVWLHLPVPKDRDDPGYFAALADLRLPAGTDLYLGLVHAGDAEGTERRIATASQTVPRFGVATECGMGRTPREDIKGLLSLHAQVADPV